MDEVHILSPSRTKSKRTRSSQSKDGHRERLQKKSASPGGTSNSTPRTRPSLTSRTTSAPLVPSLRDPKLEVIGFDPDGHSHRDSITSIKDDPFFRNYQSPHSVSLGRELRSATNTEKLRDEASPRDSSAQMAGRMMDDSVNIPPQSRSGMADINIAVIGSAGVGKSTLIQRAFGKRMLPTSIPSSMRMSVDHIAYTVSLIELDLESFDVPPNGRIQFPKQIDGLYILPRMDGALLLYDVMNRGSTTDIVQVLNGLVSSSIPTILVSCKCDNPENTRQVDVETMEEDCAACVEAVKTASNVPESARMCLSSILRAIMAYRNSNHTAEHPGTRRRATSSANLDKPSDAATSRPLSQNSKHSRASSEYSLLRGFPAPPPASSRGQANRSNTRTNLHQQYTFPDPHEAPPLSAHPAFRHDSSTESSNRLKPGQRTKSPLPSPGKAAENSFLDMEESDAESTYRYSDDIPILQRNDESFFDKPARVAGVTFEELVDRLLGQNMTRADHNFSDIFLCLYRKFAAPGELFSAILSRLDRMAGDRNIHYLTRTATQLRIITVVAKWVSSYPGDFASPSTSARLEAFIQNLASDPVFAAAAQDMRAQLHSRVVEDDDTGWARTDADVESEANSSTESGPPSPARMKNPAKNEFEDSMKRLAMDDESSTSLERQQSMADSVSSGRPHSPTHSLAPSFHTVEDYERAAAQMIPQTNLPLTKFRYHIFMDKSDDDFADEMTRIDWIMFSSIRLRDLVRDVSLSLNQKEKCKSLQNVNRMINHFNHVAKWVSNMILIRDKPKHRALMLEKFMNIALKLRQLKNYNGLAAVLAGINGSAIHRLAQTRALVPADVQKRFATLVVLMGTQKSHFAYRLAWENSTLPRIPFIPLHRRDLVSAEEGSRTFVGAKGERINWKKFEVLSEVILPIMKSQVVPYPNLRRRDDIRELVLDCNMSTDDEDIYQRSLQLESSSGSLEGGKKTKFPWFQKDK